VIDLPYVRFRSLDLGIGRREIIEKLFQIGSVVAQSMRADIPLVTQVIEELG